MGQQYEWQDEHYQHLASEVQQELCSLIGYREKIEWKPWDDMWRPYFGRNRGDIYILQEQQEDYCLIVNAEKIASVVSFCCMADSENLVAFAITETGKKKQKKMVPLFKIEGDMDSIDSIWDIFRVNAFYGERNKIEETKCRRELQNLLNGLREDE